MLIYMLKIKQKYPSLKRVYVPSLNLFPTEYFYFQRKTRLGIFPTLIHRYLVKKLISSLISSINRDFLVVAIVKKSKY